MSNLHPEEFSSREWDRLLQQHAGLNLKTYLEEQEEFIRKESLISKGSTPVQSLKETFKEKLISGTPIEYLSNRRYFYDRFFYVDERVLIPRFETELLVEMAQKVLKTNLQSRHTQNKLRVLDLACGSGCIGLSLLESFRGSSEEFNSIELTLSDLSSEALEVTRINQFRSNLPGERVCADRFENEFFKSLRPEAYFDLIVTNPPYLTKDLEIHPLTAAEPQMALFLDLDAYHKWFENLFSDAHSYMAKKGVLLMEGAPEYLSDLKDMASELGFQDVQCLQDLTGRDRFLKAMKA